MKKRKVILFMNINKQTLSRNLNPSSNFHILRMLLSLVASNILFVVVCLFLISVVLISF